MDTLTAADVIFTKNGEQHVYTDITGQSHRVKLVGDTWQLSSTLPGAKMHGEPLYVTKGTAGSLSEAREIIAALVNNRQRFAYDDAPGFGL